MTNNNSVFLNQLLSNLPAFEYQRLEPYLEEVTLTSGQVLHEPYDPIEYVYFPVTAMISLVAIMENGSTIEIGLIGNEGMIGLPVFLGGQFTTSRAIVQIRGTSFKLKSEVLLREFKRAGTFQDILLLHTQARMTQIAQNAACNGQHNIQARLARWLLSVYDCVLTNELDLTQEFISNMLGVRRAGVNSAANALQEANVISYHRGKIVILYHKKLEQMSCECYHVIRNEFMRLLGSSRG